MNIGEEKRTIIVEPVAPPIPRRTPAPAPEPNREPVPEREREKVPAGVPDDRATTPDTFPEEWL